ncbi:hypothetical protein K438DRAFT_1767721 [Mycena galopus ATCC 62051]|nr:hypothetical protein K438DRAFT_1767721 [Mycena galopus ATCC 62051]
MHSVLATPELISLMCHHLLPGFDQMPQYDIPSARSALRALACTCKALQDPALDALWREMTSLRPYLCSFPSDLLSRSPVRVWDDEPLRLTRPLVSADRAHAHINACRIRKLSLEIDPDHSDVLLAIRAFTTPAIFPNLRTLRWRSGTTDIDFHHLAMFLTPALQDISITFDPTTMLNQSLLFSLPSVCPALTRVHIQYDFPEDDHPDPPTDVVSFTSRFIQSVGAIRSVSTPLVDWAGFQHIAQHCTHVTLDRLPFGRPPSSGDLFGGLQSISLRDFPLFDAVDIFRLGSELSVHTLGLTWPDHGRAGLAEDALFTTLAKYCSHATLLHLTLAASWSIEDTAPPPPAITAPVLRVLFCFRNLVILAIEPCVQFELDDADIAAAALAWPSLESLTLSAFGCGATTPLTVLSLYALAQRCPRLRRIYMSVKTPSAGTTHVPPSSSHQLTELCIAHSPLSAEDVPFTALLLRAIFPQLWTITDPMDFSPHLLAVMWKPWAQVLSLIRGEPPGQLQA